MKFNKYNIHEFNKYIHEFYKYIHEFNKEK